MFSKNDSGVLFRIDMPSVELIMGSPMICFPKIKLWNVFANLMKESKIVTNTRSKNQFVEESTSHHTTR